jgi:NAD(P)H-hydrate epimerase
MPRDEGLVPGEQPTGVLVNELLRKYPDKRWVIDGGALQTVDVGLIRPQMILTPNARELEIVAGKLRFKKLETRNKNERVQQVQEVARVLGCTVLAKGEVDVVSHGETTELIPGGDPGMTKGGTGDVLAGIVAALYAKSPAMAASVVASQTNKLIGEMLAEKSGPYYTATEMVAEVGRVLHMVLQGVNIHSENATMQR